MNSIFAGNNIICCRGRIVTSGSYWVFLGTCAVYATALIIFYTFIFPIADTPLVFNILLHFLLFLSLYFCFKTAFTDPGILPRGTAPFSIVKQLLNSKDDSIVRHPNNNDVLVGKIEVLNGERMLYKYCCTCELFRPPKSSHCSTCDNCVLDYDHHCPWLSNCIGRRNLKFFMYFCIFTSLVSLANAIIISLIILRLYMSSSVSFVEFFCYSAIPYVFFFLFSFSIGSGLAGFVIYHALLIYQGITSSEHIKLRRGVINSTPNRQVGCNNIKSVFCDDIPKSQINWKQFSI